MAAIEKPAKTTKGCSVAKPRTARTKASKTPADQPAKRITKKAQLISHLDSPAGVTVTELSAVLGWLPHTTRAALTGLRKAGYVIEATKRAESKVSSYRITGHPVEPAQ